MDIWNFTHYRDYLLSRLGADGSRSGARKELAASISVHTTYVSQVLKGKAEFSLEQAEGINSFFNHTESEGEYFVLLVLQDRAGLAKLRKRFETKIHRMREERSNISRRLEADNPISDQDREKFYSSALYGAAHVLCSLPKFQKLDVLAAALQLSPLRAAEIVEFLLRIGVLRKEGERLLPGAQHVHLGNETELVLRHHTNWRMHCISNLQFLDKDDLHYSASLTLSEEGVFRVKEALLKALKDVVSVVQSAPPEVGYVLNFDFYKLVN